MAPETLAVLMFVSLFVLVFLGIPISFSLLATAFVFGLQAFGPNVVGTQLSGMILQTAQQFLLSAVPPFIIMGCILERSGIAERLFQTMQLWLGRLPGGLALATISMSAIFAASTGIVGAVEVVIGVMAIPVMLKYRYNKDLIAGTICAGGSLGTMIPPSLVAVIYASVANMSVGKLLAAMVLPGLLMVAAFLIYIIVRCLLWPEHGPPVPSEQRNANFREKLMISVTGLVPATLLIIAVLGSILWGVASPTEAASVGAIGAVLLTAAYGRLSWPVITDTLRRTILINCMIMLIVVGGTMFTSVFRVLGGERLVATVVADLGLGKGMVIFICLGIVFLAGFILDWVSIVLICLPIFLPLIALAKIDPIWFAVMMVIMIQTSYLTPPMAPSIFYLRSIAPPEITYKDMCLGVAPYVVCQLLTLLAVVLFPWLTTYLPQQMSGF
ncbi:MAG: TRAP transporter large permease subunit [Alphaproteobacteria bacterium]|nr:TRAP transporter large permease subunit [Alphaproteobacteria bacterium]